MCRAAALFIFLAALLPLMAGQAQAQAGQDASSTTGGTSAATSSPNSSGPSGLAGTPSPQGSFLGSVPGKLEPGVVQLSLEDAISHGLRQNLGLLLAGQDVRSSRGERWRQLSALLPNVNTSSYVADSQVDLKEFGFSFKFPGVTIPTIVGPFSYIDSRASVTQNIFDWKAVNETHSATESVKSAQHTYKDARDLVTLAVGYEYLQA
ncbi:MAG: TolC family protein, partial [Chthoniobacterales bacterium]